MTDVTIAILDERRLADGLPRRLGRHVEHDPRSKQYPAHSAQTRVSRQHHRRVGPFDQGDLGSCTGNALGGLLMTDPFARDDLVVDEDVCRMIYETATRVDGIAGYWPPTDTGSSGLGVAKAAKAAGFISGYAHAFGINHALDALVLAPVITGVHWYAGFDHPDANGLVEISGAVRGGHEFVVDEIDVERELVGAMNSWGDGYGIGGRFYFSWSTWARLLSEQGDVTTIAR